MRFGWKKFHRRAHTDFVFNIVCAMRIWKGTHVFDIFWPTKTHMRVKHLYDMMVCHWEKQQEHIKYKTNFLFWSGFVDVPTGKTTCKDFCNDPLCDRVPCWFLLSTRLERTSALGRVAILDIFCWRNNFERGFGQRGANWRKQFFVEGLDFDPYSHCGGVSKTQLVPQMSFVEFWNQNCFQRRLNGRGKKILRNVRF